MSMYNTSSAYKYEQDEKIVRAVEGRRRRLNKQKQQQTKVLYRFVNLKTICVFLVIAVMTGMVVRDYVELHELTSQISTLRSDIRRLENENVLLENQIETTISMHNIAETASRELGLQHPSAHQTVYISLFRESTIEITEYIPRETLGSRIRFGLNGAMRRIQEYIGA